MENKKQQKVHDFIVRCSWKDLLLSLPIEIRRELSEAILIYGMTGEILELKPITKAVFCVIKCQIDSENEKRRMISEARRQAGRKGGAPKGNQNASKKCHC